jgi:hypothetical protein
MPNDRGSSALTFLTLRIRDEHASMVGFVSEAEPSDTSASLPTTVVVVVMILSVIVGVVWSLGLLIAAWGACGGDFGGYGAGANLNLDGACQSRHSSTAWMPAVLVPIASAVGLFIWRQVRRPQAKKS